MDERGVEVAGGLFLAAGLFVGAMFFWMVAAFGWALSAQRSWIVFAVGVACAVGGVFSARWAAARSEDDNENPPLRQRPRADTPETS